MLPADPVFYALCGALALIAMLYACVGQAGASGFIAAMALAGFAPASIKPSAILLNACVSAIVALHFLRSPHFSWPLLRPFMLSALPAAVLGGYLTLPSSLFNLLLGSLLLLAALPLFFRHPLEEGIIHNPSWHASALAGSGIGLVSGLTGMGGGVLLAPLLLHFRWARAETATAICSVFILANSLAALIGHAPQLGNVPKELPVYLLAAVAGGAIGSRYGRHWLSAQAIRRLLGSLLFLAGLKLILPL